MPSKPPPQSPPEDTPPTEGAGSASTPERDDLRDARSQQELVSASARNGYDPFASEVVNNPDKVAAKKDWKDYSKAIVPMLVYIFGKEQEVKPQPAGTGTTPVEEGEKAKPAESGKTETEAPGKEIVLPFIPADPSYKGKFMKAVAQVESGGFPDKVTKEKPLTRYMLVQFHAIASSGTIRNEMAKDGVPPPPSELLEKGFTANKLFKEGFPQTYTDFLLALKKWNVNPKTLAYCALGKYQIVPCFHFARMGWNHKNPEDLYLFLKEPERQEALMEKMTESYGQNYNWNYAAMMATHYGGTRAGDAIASNSHSDRLSREQQLGYPSISNYVQKGLGRMSRLT